MKCYYIHAIHDICFGIMEYWASTESPLGLTNFLKEAYTIKTQLPDSKMSIRQSAAKLNNKACLDASSPVAIINYLN